MLGCRQLCDVLKITENEIIFGIEVGGRIVGILSLMAAVPLFLLNYANKKSDLINNAEGSNIFAH